MNYIGEHLLPGQIGHFAALVFLVASLIASFSYYKSTKAALPDEKQSWLKLARLSFLFETVSVLTIIGCIYYILANNLFEYKYAWEHSDKTLQTQYVFACLWEGQEGSFLLWSFWHCVLGWVIILRTKKWEAPVLTAVSFVQFCLATMLIGIYVFGSRIGSNPFVLIRNEGLLDNAPIFKDMTTGTLRADYLTLLKDGSGLNALLQNYWMVIHPPILFLGFASTVIPFAFAFAGLLTKDHSWIKTVIPWAAFSGAVLGTGIMMGAAWAYESLTFGGYWAWDPVENASLVPWLVLVAGFHTNLVYKSTGYSLKSTYFFYILAFVLILYSTFLTRSGILGDTSVHAFTGADMNVQLYLFLNIFIWFPVIFSGKTNKDKLLMLAVFVAINIISLYVPVFIFVSVIAAYSFLFYFMKDIPVIAKEEGTYSREFWMFIGSLVFFLSAIIISAKTSIPVYNKIFGTKAAPPEDSEFSYNQIQVFIAFIIGILTAVTQYLKYKDTSKAYLRKKLWLPTLIALVLSICIGLFGNINYNKKGIGFLIAIYLAIFAAIYAIVANAAYIWLVLKGKVKASGASVAHVGFGLVLLGILISSSKKEVLSWNTTGISVLQKDPKNNPAENITLFKGISTDMGKYMVTYQKDTLNEKDRKKYFELVFKSKDGTENFNLYPDVIKNNKGQEGFSANPNSKHYLHKDIFAYVTSWTDGDKEDTASFRPMPLKTGDTVFYSNGMIVLNKVDVNKPPAEKIIEPGETSMMLDITVISKDGRRYPSTPGIALKENMIRNLPDTVVAQGLVLKFNKVLDEKSGKLEIGVKESGSLNDLLTLKVYLFPFINVLWIGIIVMVTGLIMSIIQRNRKSKLSAV